MAGRLQQFGRAVLLAAFTSVALAASVGTASAEIEGPCEAFFNGVHFDDLETPAEARDRLRIPVDGELRFTGVINATEVDYVAVDIVFWPWTYELVREENTDPGNGRPGLSDWDVTVPVGDVAQYGQGIYEFRGRTDICSGNAFFLIGDGAPWDSLAGQIAAGIALLGVLYAGLTAWLPGLFRGGGGFGRAGFGGLLVGLGGAILVQQGGYYPLNAWSLGGGLAGGLIGSIVIWQMCGGINGMFSGGPPADAASGVGASPPMAGGNLPAPPPFAPPSAPAATSGAGAAGDGSIVKADPASAFSGNEATHTPDRVQMGDAKPQAAHTPDPVEIADAKPQAGHPPDPVDIADAKPQAGHTPEPIEIADAKPQAAGPASGVSAPAPTGAEAAAPTPTAGEAPTPTAGAGEVAAPTTTGVDATASSSAGGSAPASGGTTPMTPAGAAPGISAAGPLPTGAGLDMVNLAARGVLGLATSTALSKARQVAAKRAAKDAKKSKSKGAGAAQFWFYVDGPTAVYPLSGDDQIIAYLQPGGWYLAKASYELWTHAFDDDRNFEGFVAGTAVNQAPTG